MIRKEFQLVLWSWISIPVWYQIYVTGKGVMHVNSVPTEQCLHAYVCVRGYVCVHDNSTVVNIVKDMSSVTSYVDMHAIGHMRTYIQSINGV